MEDVSAALKRSCRTRLRGRRRVHTLSVRRVPAGQLASACCRGRVDEADRAGYESRLDDIRVWVFVRNKSMNLIPLGDLGAYLVNAIPADEGPVDAPSGSRAPLKSAASGEPPAKARPNTEEAPPEGLEETFRQVDWRGMFIGYVLLVEGGSIRVFRLKRSRGQLDVSYFGSYVSSAAALLALSRKGLNPDLVPVWVLSDVLGTEPTRLGAA